MIILHGINNNIIIYHPYYLCGYQDESENWEIYQDIVVLGVRTKIQNNFWTCVTRFSWNYQLFFNTDDKLNENLVG